MLIAPSACARRAGLSAAHSAGLVHRDVKPENLFLCDSFDGPRRVKVLDFGYAKIVGAATEVLSPAPHVPTTTEGIMIGTPSYYSPEQADAERDIDARADIYAMGCVLHELLTGRTPFHDRKTVFDVARAHRYDTPSPPSATAPQPIPAALDAAVMKALQKRRQDRFASADAFRTALLGLSVG